MAKIETTFIRPKELYTPETGETKVVYDGYQNNPHELITEDGFAGALDAAMPTALAKAQVIEITWQELKDKRDNGQLIPGSLYRITDYNCTTTQENTQSAGHQFDIVLLALSENKLAEEGWAMMHDNIYDVTFTDGVTKKCYVYITSYSPEDTVGNIVILDTMLGRKGISIDDLDEQNKTCSVGIDYDEDYYEGIQYNYFQNSNLSAWKVWYCLDNDTARFAWADDSVDEDVPESFIANGVKYYRYSLQDSALDKKAPYCYKSSTGDYIYVPTIVTSETEEISINTYYNPPVLNTSTQITSFTPAHEGTGLLNGRGVIYRLIDEFNNDVAYDFKNIQYIRPISGKNTWVYTYTWYDLDKNIAVDTSLDGGMMDGFIGIYNGTDSIYELSNNVIANPSGYSIKLVGTSGSCTISSSSGLLLYNCDSLEIDGVDDAIYVAGKKVLTEE